MFRKSLRQSANRLLPLPTAVATFGCIFLLTALAVAQSNVPTPGLSRNFFKCDDVLSGLCTERQNNQSYDSGKYVGHDEPSLLFYSNVPGSGNNSVYHLRIPKDPPNPPKQDGTGGTFNFQQRPVFWFGMALCDSQSSPNFTNVCNPDTDANIFDNGDPNARDFIGHHPGVAFQELQFFAPDGPDSCDPTLWCVAMTIDSLSQKVLTDQLNNNDCLARAGEEYVNFAFLTHNGVSQAPASPLTTDPNQFALIPGTTLTLNPGDDVIVRLFDTPDGFKTVVEDLTTHQTGSMTASTANGFAQLKFDPTAATCTALPYAFHPMYSTSSEHTRVTWAAHSYNIAYSDEIGHFEFCNAVAQEGGNCISPGVQDPTLDADDSICFSGAFLGSFGLQPIGQCFNADVDFDGTPYQTAAWVGAGTPRHDALFTPTPIRFTSPLFQRQRSDRGYDGGQRDYQRVAFEADLPAIEAATTCNRTTGAGCTNPPPGAQFYPIFSTAKRDGNCAWEEGGGHIVGTQNNFGGTSTAEYGPLLLLTFPGPADATHPNGTSFQRFEDNRRILNNNPCRAGN